MNRLRLLCLLPNLNGGGAERVMIYLLRGLDRTRFEPTLALGRVRGPYVSLVPSDVRLIELGRDRAAWAVADIARHLREERYDLCFSMVSMNLAAVLARWLARSATRLVLGARNHYSRSLPAEATFSPLKQAAIRILYPNADLVIAVSEGVRLDLIRHFGLSRRRTIAIHNPVDIAAIRAQAAAQSPHRWFRDAAEVPVLVAVGKLQEAKGYPHLLEALRQLNHWRQVRLLILGEGPLRPLIERHIHDYGLAERVELVGFQMNPYAYLVRASVFVHAALWEGFPNVLVEAMACGAPVVAADCPSGPSEIITNDAEGALVPVADPTALAAAVRDVLADSLRLARMKEAGQRRARDFSVQTVVNRYADAFEHTASG